MKVRSHNSYLFMNIVFAVVTCALIICFFTMLSLDFARTPAVVFLIILLAWLAAFAVWCASRLDKNERKKTQNK